MQPASVLTIYCVLVGVASLGGGWLPSLLKLNHKRMQILMSFLGGMMMGVAILHLMPHAAAEAGSFDVAAISTMIGLLGTMLMIRWFHFHQHELPPDTTTAHDHDCGHDHDHDESHDHPATDECAESPLTSRFGWIGVCIGLSVHAIMDGVALGASVSGHAHDATLGFIGLGTFLAIALHKPLDSLSITSLMTVAGFTGFSRVAVNFGYALLCPIGAVACYFGVQGLGDSQSLFLGWALGLSAGIFLCIALVDVLPEVQFHRHDRGVLSVALAVGVLVAWAIGLVEPPHSHGGHETATEMTTNE
jgi:zinc and cadmium transporter